MHCVGQLCTLLIRTDGTDFSRQCPQLVVEEHSNYVHRDSVMYNVQKSSRQTVRQSTVLTLLLPHDSIILVNIKFSLNDSHPFGRCYLRVCVAQVSLET